MRSTGLLSAAAAVGAVLLGAGLAAAEPTGHPAPTASEIAASITALDLMVADVIPQVTELDTATTDGEETVIALTTDVLFDFDKADLPANAPEKIAEILADVAEGTQVRVEGHTDSMGTEGYNQELSERRAQAVADVIARVRPDLRLTVEGFGMSRPVADNTVAGKDNPDGRALNRRVEIRYTD